MSKCARQSGFTLIELLITVAIIGVIAAIAIPNLLNAIDRAKQKRTMADLRGIATAVESYNVDNSAYPTATDVSSLSALIRPGYIDTVPPEDGWGHAFVIQSVPLDYTIGSGGKDGGSLVFVGGPTSNFDDAIIFSDGTFVQWPEGTQN